MRLAICIYFCNLARHRPTFFLEMYKLRLDMGLKKKTYNYAAPHQYTHRYRIIHTRSTKCQ